MKLRDASLQVYKKTFCIYSSMYFAFIFSRITITSSQKTLKLCKHSFFQELHTLVLLLFYLFCLEYVCFQIKKLEFFVSWTTSLFYAGSKKKVLKRIFFFLLPSWFVLVCTSVFFVFFLNLIVALHPGRNAFLFYFYIYDKFTLPKII